MTETRSKLKHGMKLFAPAKKGSKFFHLDSALLSRRVYPQLAAAFKNAADMIIDLHLSVEGGSHHDTLQFPVLYLYRHCLELQLKDMVLLGIRVHFFSEADIEKILDKEVGGKTRKGIISKHELCPLWTKAERLILHSYPKDDQAQVAKSMIHEIHRIDPDGETLRYDRKKGTLEWRGYENLPSTIDIATLRTNMDLLYCYLDNSYAGIADEWAESQHATEYTTE